MEIENADTKQNVPNGVGAIAAGNTPETRVSTVCPPKKRWTILLDIAADGVLANFGIETLKQLKNSASIKRNCKEETEVTVAAQFSVDAPAGQKIPRYVFGPKTTGGSLSDCIADYLDAPKSMTEEQALIDFLQWASRNEDLNKADYYAVILWGHGPELLMQPPPAHGNDSVSLYLTPIELRRALQAVLHPR